MRQFSYRLLFELYSGPYENIFLSEEWPWISNIHTKLSPYASFNCCPRPFNAQIYGWMLSSVLPNTLFKSSPRNPVRKLPKTTPSGFSIGIIFSMLLLRNCYSSLPRRLSSRRVFISPYNTNEEQVSLGCTRQDIRYTFLCLSASASEKKPFLLQIVIIGMAKPVTL